MITQKELKELLHYDPETGIFTWKVGPYHRQPNKIAGTLKKDSGYIVIFIKGRAQRAHRLAWLYMYGDYMTTPIDHINRNKADNRICNLRLATKSQNAMNTKINANNKSGYKGVSWSKSKKKWRAHLKINYKQKFLGYYDDVHEAGRAYKKAALKYFGEFAS